jgi:PAS domain S-box-containing protein
VGHSPAILRGSDTDPAVVAMLAQRRRAMEPIRAELLNYRKDGSPVWVDISAKPCGTTADGQAIYLSVQRDITALKLREIALTEALAAKALLGAVSDAVSSETHIFDADTLRYVQVNQAARRALAGLATPLSDLSPVALWRDVPAERLRAVVAPLVQGVVREVTLELIQRAGDGRTYPCSARLSCFQHNGLRLIVASLDDLSERRRADERLRLTEERFRLAVEASTDGIWERVLPDGPAYFSPRNREMLGYSRREFPDAVESWRRCAHPDDMQRVLDALQALIERDAPFDVTYRMRRSDGRWVWWRSRATVMRDAQGRAIRVIGTNSDVTELVAARQAAETLARDKADFLARMSHEIRTPLNGVLGMAEVMRFAESDPQKLSRLDTILSSGQSLLAIIEDVLTLARIDVECVGKHDTLLDLTDLGRAAFAPVQVAAEAKGLRLCDDLAADAGAGPLIGDARRIRQVLINLVGNALKYTPQGEIRLTSRREGPMLRFEVSDTGPGVPPELRDSVFEPFRQGRNGDASGLGLGLSVAREIVRAMGGQIGVTSAHDGGACFWFTAPVRQDAEGVASLGSDPSGRQPTSRYAAG